MDKIQISLILIFIFLQMILAAGCNNIIQNLNIGLQQQIDLLFRFPGKKMKNNSEESDLRQPYQQYTPEQSSQHWGSYEGGGEAEDFVEEELPDEYEELAPASNKDLRNHPSTIRPLPNGAYANGTSQDEQAADYTDDYESLDLQPLRDEEAEHPLHHHSGMMHSHLDELTQTTINQSAAQQRASKERQSYASNNIDATQNSGQTKDKMMSDNDYDYYEEYAEDCYGHSGSQPVPPNGSMGKLGPRAVPNKRRPEDVQGEETVVVTHEGGTYERDHESEPGIARHGEDGGDDYDDDGESGEEIGDYGPIRGKAVNPGRPDALRQTKIESPTGAEAVGPSIGPKPSQKCIDSQESEPEISPRSKAGEGAERAAGASESQDRQSKQDLPSVDEDVEGLLDEILDEAEKSKKVIMGQINKEEIPLKPHERRIGQYILGKTIGEGTFGKVKIGMHILTKARVAVKILEKSKIVDVADVERVSREIHILKIVQHPQVVQLYEIIETPKKLYLIMEYASGGELFDYIVKHQRVQEKEACKFFQQLLGGIEYVSRLNIVHRDLKPENLLLDFDKGIKIVDFGLSNTYKTGELLKTACGSPCYAAPEMIAGKKYNGTNVDIWSCGVILFALICGYLPFEDPNTSNLYKKILSADFQTPNYVSDEAKDLFHCILNTDPEKRYTIEQIRAHAWFNLVPCEANFKGIQVGVDPVPIDQTILDQMDQEYSLDKSYARKCIQANKHNQVTASYYLLLKELIKKGEKSLADVRRPDYDPKRFIHSAKSIRRERAKEIMRDKLENASMQLDIDGDDQVEEEDESQEVGHGQLDEDGLEVPGPVEQRQTVESEVRGRKREEDKRGKKSSKEGTAMKQSESQASAKAASKKGAAARNKSIQPQRLRKIADGLVEFERYADRKKRLQNISDKQEREARVKNMNIQLSQNYMAEDMLSNGGGLDLLKRGISPIAGHHDGTIPDSMSNFGYNYDVNLNNQNQQSGADPGLVFSQNFLDYNEFPGDPSLLPGADREQSPGLSPHSLRVNAHRGVNGMQTQYGNFLYQVEAKQFPGQFKPVSAVPQSSQQPTQSAQQQMQLQGLVLPSTALNPMPMIDTTNLNAKQIHKQLKQFYLQQKKAGAATGGHAKQNGNQQPSTNHEAILKNLVNLNASDGSGTISNKGMQAANGSMLAPNTSSQLCKMQLLQQNYQPKKGSIGGPGLNQNFSTIQTAYETLQQNNQSLIAYQQHYQGKKKNSQGGGGAAGQLALSGAGAGGRGQHGGTNMAANHNFNASMHQSIVPHHQRFATTHYGGGGNPVFNTISQNIGGAGTAQGYVTSAQSVNSPTGIMPLAARNAKFAASTQSTFLNATHGSRLAGAQNPLKQSSGGKQGKRHLNATVSGSGSLGPVPRQAGIFSPKNLPNTTLGFGFGYDQFDNVLTPQTQQQQRSLANQLGASVQNQNHLFTIDTTSQGLSQQLHMTQQNQTIQPPSSKPSKQQPSLSSQLVQSLKPQMPRKSSQVSQSKGASKQHSQPVVASPTGGPTNNSQLQQSSNTAGSGVQRTASNKRKLNGQNKASAQAAAVSMSHQGNITNNTISYGNGTTNLGVSLNEGSTGQNNDAQASIQSSKAQQFKRRRDHSKQGRSGQKYSQYGTIQQAEQTVRSGAPQPNHSKNNLNISAYHSSKPPLSISGNEGGGRPRQGSHDGKARLNNTQPISSQKKISKHRAANAAAVASTEKIRHGPGKGSSLNAGKNNKVSMQRIIDTSQNLASMNINLYHQDPQSLGAVGMATALSAKNSSLLASETEWNAQTAVASASIQTTHGKGQAMHNYQRVFSPQNISQSQHQQALLHQEQLQNLSRIQAQLQLKKSQRQAAQVNAAGNSVHVAAPGSATSNYVNPAAVSPLSIQSTYTNPLDDAHAAVMQQMNLNASQFAQTSTPSNLNTSLQIKKGGAVHSSLLAQNCAPHLLLQSCHGTGYPPIGHLMQLPMQLPMAKSPQNTHYAPLSPVYGNPHITSGLAQSPHNPAKDLSMLQQAAQLANAGRDQHRGLGAAPNQPNSTKNQQARRKTPQIATNMGGAVSLSGVAGPPPASHPSQAFRANTGMLSNLNIQQHAQGSIPSPSMYRAKASAATSSAGKAKHPQRAGNSQQPVSQTTILNQKQIKMANSNTRANKQASANMVAAANGQAMPRDQPQLRQMNPNANQATIVQLQVQLNSFPVSAKNQQRTRSSKQKISTAQQQNYSAEYHHQAHACALALDSSKIEYLDEVDVSSNTIQNINQQLCQGLNQPHPATMAHANMLAALHDNSQMGPYINHNTSYQLQEDSRGLAIGKGGAQKRKARSKKRAAPATGAY